MQNVHLQQLQLHQLEEKVDKVVWVLNMKTVNPNMIEYRIKLVTKENIVFLGGESQIVNTACVIKRKKTSQCISQPMEIYLCNLNL